MMLLVQMNNTHDFKIEKYRGTLKLDNAISKNYLILDPFLWAKSIENVETTAHSHAVLKAGVLNTDVFLNFN